MRTYALQNNNKSLGIPNDTKFNFHAKDMDEAISLAKGWCHYHGKCFTEEYLVIEEEAKNSSWIDNKSMIMTNS